MYHATLAPTLSEEPGHKFGYRYIIHIINWREKNATGWFRTQMYRTESECSTYCASINDAMIRVSKYFNENLDENSTFNPDFNLTQ